MKPLSDRLLEEVGYWPKTSTLDSLLREAAALAKSVESAPLGELVEVMERSSIVNWDQDAPSHLYGHRVALVPLPQQSES